MAKMTTGKMKKKAWTEFSRYIRLKYSDDEGYVRCVTCGTVKHWKEIQAGHFIDGRTNAVLFREDLVYPQCYGCNVGKKGNKVSYTMYMMNKGYTKEAIEKLLRLRTASIKYSVADLKEIHDKYKALAKDLEEELH